METEKKRLVIPSRADGRFWMVWCPQGRAPTATHGSLVDARLEAQRLARLAPGQFFIVLEAVDAYHLPPPAPPPVMRVDLDRIETEVKIPF